MPISLKNTAPILPYLRYSPQANTMTTAGEDGKPREIPFVGKSFAMDPESGSPGWLLIDSGVRDWKPFTLDSAVPSPGPNYKRGFSILLYAPKLLGDASAFEMCSSTAAFLSFAERLYNETEPNFGKGNVPIVKITASESIQIGKGKPRELHFEVVSWIPRPSAIVEALAKLKAANATPGKNASGAANTDAGGDDFDDEDVTAASPKEESADKPAAEKSKRRGKKAQPEQQNTSDLLNDELPF